MKISKHACAADGSNDRTRLLFAGLTLLVLLTPGTAYGQATYSDVWIDDSASNENGEGAFVIGRGVSEINYVDEDGVEVITTITSPNGRSASSGAFGEVSAQADASLAWDWDDFIGNFTVNVERFPMCEDGWMPSDDGILITHGYNGRTGTLWWRPSGWSRCPRNSYALVRAFPIGVSYLKMQKISTTPAPVEGGFIYTYERVEPCDITCRNMLRHTTNIDRGDCVGFAIPYGPLGCFIFTKIISNTTCVCYDTNNN